MPHLTKLPISQFRDTQNPNHLDIGKSRAMRIPRLFVGIFVFAASLGLGGCASLWPGKSDDSDNESKLSELLKVPEAPDLIREATASQGLQPIEVDGVGLVKGLPGTGGPPDPSVYRDQLLDEMKRHDIVDPNHYLELSETALVRVRASIPPGARRGDPIDVRVLAPKESRATDLHGGWLLDTRLRQQQVLRNAVRQSEVMAIGTGRVLTRADHAPGDDVFRVEGNIQGGGRVQVTRKIGLVIRPKYQHAKLAAGIAAAINRRFFFFDGTTRRGIATPISDDFIEVEVHPRYRGNVNRLMTVARAIGLKPKADSQERLAELASQMKDPETAADAALQLEGLGESAVPTLLEGLQSENPELRFYAAETLAFLDRVESIRPLEEAARSEPAFRRPAILALEGLEHQLATEALQKLFDEPSLETRYGSFCALRRHTDGKRLLKRQAVGSFWLYQIPSDADAAIAASLREESEIVLFGQIGELSIRQFLRGPSGLLIRPDATNPRRLAISRFQPGKEDMRSTSTTSVRSLIEGIAKVGGSYGDVVAVLRIAKDKGYLKDQLAIDPLPNSKRVYYREPKSDDSDANQSDVDSSAGEADLVITGETR